MVVRTAGDDLIALVDERLRHNSGVLLDLLLVDLELRTQRFTESDCLSGYHVLQRTALCTREDRRVE